MEDSDTVFLVVNIDRHTDPYISVRVNRTEAINYARKLAQQASRDPASFDETNDNPKEFLYHARYSCEGDCVYVLEKVVGED